MASLVTCRVCGLTADTSAPFCEGCGGALEGMRHSTHVDLGPPRAITIGRDAGCDYPIAKPTISKQHALVELLPGQRIRVQDVGSANGVAINSPGNRISEGFTDVQFSDRLFLGRTEVAVSEILLSTVHAHKAPRGKAEVASIRMRGNTIVFGRDTSADFQIPHPMVSKRHATLSREGKQYFIEDLGSTNGTFVRGRRLAPRVKVQVRVGDEIGFGSYTLVLNELGTLKPTPEQITITAETLTVRVTADRGMRELLGDVSLTIEPGDMVALMGPSGAGKTTFLQALNGITPLSGGRVLYRNLDLAEHFDSFRTMIGYVPQDDIMHSQLTVYKALYYTAKLRLPADYTRSQIDERIRSVLADVGLEDKMDEVIGDAVSKTLSGGQRKRVNLAMELLPEPWVLFLDEPTSGLSAVDARSVIELLREKFARRNRTIIVTIHQPSLDVYSQFNLLAMISNHPPAANAPRVPGRLVYFGPAMEAFDFFVPNGGAAGKARNPEEIETGLLKQPVDRWVQRYGESAFKRIYVGDRKESLAGTAPVAPPRPHKDRLRQLGILTQRLTDLKVRDKAQLIIALALPAIFGILVSLAQSNPGGEPSSMSAFQQFLDFGKRISTAHFLMVVAAMWFGCNNAIREIVGERAIYRRERLLNLSLLSYFSSKYVVLGALGLLQCGLMLVIVYLRLGLRADVTPTLLMLWLTTMTGSGIGLCISSMMRSNEQAIASMPLALLPMIVLGGSLSTVTFMHQNQPLGWLSDMAPTRWAFEGNFILENEAQGAAARFAVADVDVPAERVKDLRQQCQDTADRLQQISGQAQACQQKMASMRREILAQGVVGLNWNSDLTGVHGADQHWNAFAASQTLASGGPQHKRSVNADSNPGSDASPPNPAHPATESPTGYTDMANAVFPSEPKAGEIFIPRHAWSEAMGRLAALAAFWAMATLAMLKRSEWKWWQSLATRFR